jgi:hypothetical protein
LPVVKALKIGFGAMAAQNKKRAVFAARFAF